MVCWTWEATGPDAAGTVECRAHGLFPCAVLVQLHRPAIVAMYNTLEILLTKLSPVLLTSFVASRWICGRAIHAQAHDHAGPMW